VRKWLHRGGGGSSSAMRRGAPGAGSRRDRHGRGMRGPLAPFDVPLGAGRAARFDDLVVDAAEHLRRRWPDELARIEFAVDDVPSLENWDRTWVPLARSFPAQGTLPARLVVYRRPIETRAHGLRDLAVLIHDVVVEEVAELLGVEPDQLDPGYGRGHG
jgi:predicted Zn-dependent protease with MMP-like domain